MIKTIITDLDGTLLRSDKKISKEDLFSLNSCYSNGLSLIIATGRPKGEALNLLEPLGINKISALISNDGFYIDYHSRQYVVGSYMNSDDVEKIQSVLGRKKECLICTKDNSYLLVRSSTRFIIRQLYNHLKRRRDNIRVIKNIKRLQKEKIMKIKFFFRVETKKAEEICNMRYVVNNMNQCCEILSYNVSKWNAIVNLENMKGLDLKSCIFFGDEINDIKCFENLVYTVAMGSSPELIKEKALFVTCDSDNNGVTYALEHFKNELYKGDSNT